MSTQSLKKRPNLRLNLNLAKKELQSEQFQLSPFNRISNMNMSENQKKNLNSFFEINERRGGIKSEDFEGLEELGFGSHGVVFKVKHKSSGIVMARKAIRLEVKSEVNVKIIRELEISHKCRCPYIIDYYGSYQEEGQIFILTEFMNRGSLEGIYVAVKRIPENILSKIILDVVKGLVYLKQDLKVIHRDVKPSNILLNSEGEIKICDFGISRTLQSSIAKSFIGTRSYMAPERLLGDQYTVRADVWSVGIMMVELLLGKYPYPVLNEQMLNELMEKDIHTINIETLPEKHFSLVELLDFIVNEEPPKLSPKFFKTETCDFVEKCLVKDQVVRSNFTELLNHSFLKNAENITIKDYINNLPVFNT